MSAELALKKLVAQVQQNNGELLDRMREMEAALKALVHTPHIHAYLSAMDPKAFRQATDALGYDAKLEPLPDLRDLMLMAEALSLLHTQPIPADEATPARGRQLKRLTELRNRLLNGLDPLIEREKTIAAEEDAREARKAAYDEH